MGKRPPPASLPLERFAAAKLGKYDKRAALEKAHLHKLNKLGQYKRLVNRMEAEGALRLSTLGVTDNVGALEQTLQLQPQPQQQRAGVPGTAQAAAGGDAAQQRQAQAASTSRQGAAAAGSGGKRAGHGSTDATGAARQGAARQPPPPPEQRHEGPLHARAPGGAAKKRKGAPEAHTHTAGTLAAPSQPASKKQRMHQAQGGQKQGARHVQGAEGHVQRVHGSRDQDGGPALGPSTSGAHPPHSSSGTEGEGHGRRPAKHQSRMQRLAEERRVQREEARRAAQEAQRAREEQQARVEASKKARGKQKHEFFKRTRTGQPVMKHRMDKLLQALQQSVA